jgi:Holliday junction DNA helicase RuvB
MDKFEVLEYLNQHPEYARVLKLAVEDEEKNAENSNYLGWDWTTVRAYASVINKLIVDGLVKKTYDSANFTNYKLTNLETTKQVLQEFETLTEKPTPEEEEAKIPENLFDIIVGYEPIKKAVILGLKSEKPVHVLLVGPPATAKSMILEELNRVPGSSYHLGSSSTKAGLANFLFEYRPRILLIDELEKMKAEDLAVLLSLMESGKVVETKYNRRREEYMKVTVIAACNSLKGIPAENISRFRPFTFHLKEYTPEEFKKVVVEVLTKRENIDQELAECIAEKLATRTRDVRSAVGLGRICKTKEDVDRMIAIITEYQGFK